MQDFRRNNGARVAMIATESYPVLWEYPSRAEAVTRDERSN